MVLPSGMTTTIMVGASNTSTGGPAVFTGAAAKRNAVVGWTVAGAAAVMALGFL